MRLLTLSILLVLAGCASKAGIVTERSPVRIGGDVVTPPTGTTTRPAFDGDLPQDVIQGLLALKAEVTGLRAESKVQAEKVQQGILNVQKTDNRQYDKYLPYALIIVLIFMLWRSSPRAQRST